LEKGRFGITTKFWLTNQPRLQRHGLEECIRFSTGRATVGTFLGTPAVATGSFAVVDESRLLKSLFQRCHQRGITLLDQTEASSFFSDGERLSIQTNRGPILARLIVDATGGMSQIAASFRLHNVIGFYSIFGGHLQDLTMASSDVVGAYVIRFGDPPPLFEVIPTSATSAFVIVFLASRRLHPPSSLRSSFDDHIRRNPFFHCNSPTQPLSARFGAIPIGQGTRRIIPGLLSCGEAAMIQSPLLGAAFNEVLDHTDGMAEAIDEAFVQMPSGIVTVPNKRSYKKRLNDLLQLSLARKLTDGSLEDFEEMVRYLDKIGPNKAYDLFCTDLSGAGLITAARLSLALARNSPFKARRSDVGPSWLRPPSE
jgi:flavin-dependent dehydrogenase